MNYARTTQVFNALFDELLPTLSNKELKVLLIIIRQTVGWITPDGKRKKRDWISQKLFIKKTGLSAKSVSEAIKLLSDKKLIVCTDQHNKKLKNAFSRQGKNRIYYQLSANLITFLHKPYVKTTSLLVKKSNNTKLTLTKKGNTNHNKKNARLSDLQRYFEVMREKRTDD